MRIIMKFFDRLERKFGRYAIQGLMRYFVILYGAGFALAVLQPATYYQFLSLNPAAILKGQVWRLFTFLIFPPSTSPIWGILLLLMYYSLGITLERVWGSFRFNCFMFSGVLFHILAAFLIFFATGQNYILTPSNLNLSIFLAFALTFPEMQFYLYFVIPVKAKYLAIFYLVLEGYAFFAGGPTEKVTIFLSLLNLGLFLWLSGTFRRFSPSEMRRKQAFRNAMRGAGQGGHSGGGYPGGHPGGAAGSGHGGAAGENGKIIPLSRTEEKRARHRCTICGRTELDAPDLDFRYCSKCVGDHEYCSEHLYTHIHITEDNQKPQGD